MTTLKNAKFAQPLAELLVGSSVWKEGIISPDERTLIFSLILGFFLVFAGMLFRRNKYGIPFKESLRMLWQEGIVDGFKLVTKKVIDWLLECEDNNGKRRNFSVKNPKNKEQSTTFMLMLVLLVLALMAVVLAVKIGNSPIALEVLLVNVFQFFVSEVAIAAFATFLIICVHWFNRHTSFGILETVLHLLFDKMQQKLALKNAQQIAPSLQLFLWQTLNRSKSLLGIDPGPDMRALSPNGLRTAYRNGMVYYVFELAMKNEPEQEEKVLQQIVNQFISAELLHYGIDGLAAFYGGWQAVYLDRLVYDDVRRFLMFDVLYVASDKAAAALASALERDRPKAAAPEMDVFDDEL